VRTRKDGFGRNEVCATIPVGYRHGRNGWDDIIVGQ
jgi:hypothetical protein